MSNFANPWTVASQALVHSGFFSKDTGVGAAISSLVDLPDPEIEPRVFASKLSEKPAVDSIKLSERYMSRGWYLGFASFNVTP